MLDFRELSSTIGNVATDIGTKIKRARERKRWSQRHLAGLLGVSQKTVDNWEHGRTGPRSSIGALEEVLDIRLDDEPGEPEMPTEEELGRLREHVRDVLGDKAAAVEAAIDATLKGGDQEANAAAAPASERGASQFSRAAQAS